MKLGDLPTCPHPGCGKAFVVQAGPHNLLLKCPDGHWHMKPNQRESIKAAREAYHAESPKATAPAAAAPATPAPHRGDSSSIPAGAGAAGKPGKPAGFFDW